MKIWMPKMVQKLGTKTKEKRDVKIGTKEEEKTSVILDAKTLTN